MAAYQYVYVMKNLTKSFPGGREVFKGITLSFLPGVKIPIARPLPPKPAAMPVATPVAPPARRQATQAARPARAEPASPPPQPRRPSRRARDDDEEEEEAAPKKGGGPFGLSTRDLIMLAVGIGGLAVVIAIGLAAFAILSRR